jgi:hypothetical protein
MKWENGDKFSETDEVTNVDKFAKMDEVTIWQ